MSDEDFFGPSQKEIRNSTEVPRFISKSQPKPSDVVYMWVVVFHWDIGNKDPFSLQCRSAFSAADIPETWYSFKLRNDLRKNKIRLDVLNGEYSVFCKVEKGNIKKKVVFVCWGG